MENTSAHGFATRQIHAGAKKDAYGSLTGPIYQTSTFRFNTVEQGGARFAGEEKGFIYTRLGNPTLQILEERIASLEGSEDALAAASGMGAITSAIWSAVSAGDEILADETLYGCTFALLNHGMDKFGVKTLMTDMENPENIRPLLSPKTKVVYFESPCNPTLKIIDIQKVSQIAHEYNPNILVIVDNTFCSPYLQRPVELGADVSVHSATKYLNGHGDVIAGFVAGSKEFIAKCRSFGLKDMTGAVMSPFDAFLITRGLKTLSLRMERHCENARKVADFLKNHKAVKKVYYPGFADLAGHETAKKQMKDFGGMIAVELNATKEKTAECINRLKLISIAVSLGDTETLVEHPATMTHSVYTPEELELANISPSLLRMSVGLCDPEDIIADLEQALSQL